MGKLKDQLAGIAALIAAIVAIGGGFVKYGEIVTKLDAIEAKEETVVDTSAIESAIAVLEEKVNKLENIDTSHTHKLVEHNHPVEHDHTTTLINKKEIELLKVQIEEVKVKATNPLAN
jgi:ribosomal protein L16 Arg81 hydroxylase